MRLYCLPCGDMFRWLKYFRSIAGGPEGMSWLVYGGTRSQDRKHGRVLGWREFIDQFVAE